jgi:hypothetical protein
MNIPFIIVKDGKNGNFLHNKILIIIRYWVGI